MHSSGLLKHSAILNTSEVLVLQNRKVYDITAW